MVIRETFHEPLLMLPKARIIFARKCLPDSPYEITKLEIWILRWLLGYTIPAWYDENELYISLQKYNHKRI